jgi:hypothetical protein
MILIHLFSSILPVVLAILVKASPADDPQVREFLQNEARIAAASKRQTRHLRPVNAKRDSITPPDIGQIGNFHGANPEPIRGPLGNSFLAGTNTVIDEQNIDNIAPPTTDAGMSLVKCLPDGRVHTRFVCRSRAESQMEYVSVAYETLERRLGSGTNHHRSPCLCVNSLMRVTTNQ